MARGGAREGTVRDGTLDHASPPSARPRWRRRVDHWVVDDGEIAQKVAALAPNGRRSALELVGTNTLRDPFAQPRSTASSASRDPEATKCIVERFHPIELHPRRVCG